MFGTVGRSRPNSCGFVWLGISKTDNGVWVGSNDAQPITYSNWKHPDEATKSDYNYAIMDRDGYWIASKNTGAHGNCVRQHETGENYFYYNVICAII